MLHAIFPDHFAYRRPVIRDHGMTRPTRIHILGGPASGKTTLAARLATEAGISHLELDSLFWDDEAPGYAVRRDPLERDRLLARHVQSESWIVEGVYWSWCLPSFQRADQILLMDSPTWMRQWRLAGRFAKRMAGIETSLKKESFRGYYETAMWNAAWNRKNLPGALEMLKAFTPKVQVLRGRG